MLSSQLVFFLGFRFVVGFLGFFAFSGLSESDAGQIVEKLNEQGTPYQLRGSGTILVPSDKVYEIRLQMAREGLPEGGTVGFELFSGNMLGMTDFTQRINYQRALEGELERTIMSLASVSEVWVHIVTPEKSLLESEQNPATASVTVKSSGARQFDTTHVQSIIHLVSSSVEGLLPENVVVVGVEGNLLASGSAGGDMAATITTLIIGNPNVYFVYHHSIDGRLFSLDTREIKQATNAASLSDPVVVYRLTRQVREALQELETKAT